MVCRSCIEKRRRLASQVASGDLIGAARTAVSGAADIVRGAHTKSKPTTKPGDIVTIGGNRYRVIDEHGTLKAADDR